MEKMNSTAVDQVVPTPFLIKPKISLGPKPQISAATIGTTTKIGTGFVLPWIKAHTMIIIIKNPTKASIV